MGKGYRSWAERRNIIRAMIADSNPPSLATFHLTPSEEAYFRARAAKAVDALAQQTSEFKSYYSLPTAKPFGYVIGMSALIVAGAAIAATYLYLRSKDATSVYPLFAACATLAVAATGWAVAGWITHRNTIRQNTNAMLFARFSQAPFGEAMHHFHTAFGIAPTDLVTHERITELRASANPENVKAATSVTYLLNYFEFISLGVIRGDLDQGIVRDNIRGVLIYYHDKCEPVIRRSNRVNPKSYENLIKLRTHYREP